MRLPCKVGENLAVERADDASGECVGCGTRGVDRRVVGDAPAGGGDAVTILVGEEPLVCLDLGATVDEALVSV